MALNSLGVHPLMYSHKYIKNHCSHCSSWIMSEDLLSEGGWHMVGSQNSPNYSKEPGGMMSVDNLTKGLILVSARDL